MKKESGTKKCPRPLLFDLQALLCWADGEVPTAVIRRVKEGSMVFVSIVTPWEFVLKETRYKFNIDYGELFQTMRQLEAQVLPIKEAHLDRLHSMAVIEKHHDPFDRLLIAQALQENLVLVGGDEKFPAYQKAYSLQLLW